MVPVVRDLHRFFIAISRAVVNADDSPGIAPDPLVCSAGGLPKRRRVVRAVRDAALLPGPAPIRESGSVGVLPTSITADDVGLWPYSVGALVKLAAFVGTLHWPASSADLGIRGVSYVELLIPYELWAGDRIRLEKAVPRGRRIDRPISVSAVPPRPGIDIGRSCRFLGWNASCVACFAWWVQVGFCRVVLVPTIAGFGVLGGRRLVTVLPQGPVKLPLYPFWMSCWFFLVTFPGLGLALLECHLPLRYCATRFACKVPTWRLPVGGGVAGLLAENGDGVAIVRAASSAPGSGKLDVLGDCSGGVGSGLSGRGLEENSTQQKKPSS